jgi:hypothetical protein
VAHKACVAVLLAQAQNGGAGFRAAPLSCIRKKLTGKRGKKKEGWRVSPKEEGLDQKGQAKRPRLFKSPAHLKLIGGMPEWLAFNAICFPILWGMG